MSETAIETYSFEDALNELEEIVRELENAQADLETSIERYERGTELKNHCLKKLSDARMKVEKIVETQNGEASVEPLDNSGE
ncbi:MAG: exodeoxyribonuclease VII small subunit [Rickettsiales bacterium]|nr:exodeoxyribonuclease VII small subunit [Rickettsiales bacterium]